MSRCKSCNAIMQEREIVWIAEEQRHEELCMKCINSIYDDEMDSEIEGLYNYDVDIKTFYE